MTGLTVLCVDPESDEREATCASLEAEGEYDTIAAGTLADARESLQSRSVDCLVTEYDLPDGTGLDMVADIREQAPDTPCVLFTTASPDVVRTDGREDVVVEYLPKDTPEALSSLVRLVDNVIGERSQVGYPLPTAEDERLAALAQYDVPGLTAADTFDRLAALAQAHFDVDIAFVGLVDAHEERFIACQGAEWETLTRENSICTHTILGDEVLVVEDTHDDPRFTDVDRLDELGIRSYLGAPLRTPEGAGIGAFCLTHDEPRSFSEADIEQLRRYADEAMEQLELRRRLREHESESDDVSADGPGTSPTGEQAGGGDE